MSFRGECTISLAGEEFDLVYDFKSHRFFSQFADRTVASVFASLEEDQSILFDPSFVLPLIACGMVSNPNFKSDRTKRLLQHVEELLMSELDLQAKNRPGTLMQYAMMRIAQRPIEALAVSMGKKVSLDGIIASVDELENAQAALEDAKGSGNSPLAQDSVENTPKDSGVETTGQES